MEIIHRLLPRLRRLRIKNKELSLITCDCFGGIVYSWYDLQFCSPTINLHIYPEEFAKFCGNLKHYLSCEITPVSEFTDAQRVMLERMYKRKPEKLKFPFGMCDDVLIGFLHYSSFEEAAGSWNRRKARVNYDHLKFVLRIEDIHKKSAEQFDSLPFPPNKKIIFCINCEFKAHNSTVVPLKVPETEIWLNKVGPFKHYYDQHFDLVRWMNS